MTIQHDTDTNNTLWLAITTCADNADHAGCVPGIVLCRDRREAENQIDVFCAQHSLENRPTPVKGTGAATFNAFLPDTATASITPVSAPCDLLRGSEYLTLHRSSVSEMVITPDTLRDRLITSGQYDEDDMAAVDNASDADIENALDRTLDWQAFDRMCNKAVDIITGRA